MTWQGIRLGTKAWNGLGCWVVLYACIGPPWTVHDPAWPFAESQARKNY